MDFKYLDEGDPSDDELDLRATATSRSEPSAAAKPTKGKATRPLLSHAEAKTKLAAVLSAWEEQRDFIISTFVYNEATMRWWRLDDITEFDVAAVLRTPEFIEAFDTYQRLAFAEMDYIKTLADEPALVYPPLQEVPFRNLLTTLVRHTTVEVHVFGEDRLLVREVLGVKRACLNLAMPSSVEAAAEPQTDEDVEVYVNHIRLICRKESATAEVLLDWLAWFVQNPTQKIRWAPLIFSGQGIGKDSLVKPIMSIIGRHNAIDIEPAELEGAFNEFDGKKLVVLNEMLASSRYSTYDKLKPRISGTGAGEVQVNPKFGRKYFVVNRSGWMVFSNHPDAMPLETDDRRFFVIAGQHPCEPDEKPAYFDRLHDWYTAGGTERLYRWLLDRDVSGFDANRPPASTNAKRSMAWEAMSEFARWVASHLDAGKLKGRTIISTTEIKALADAEGVGRDYSPKKATEALRHHGMASVGQHSLVPGRANHGVKSTVYAIGAWEGTTSRDTMVREMPPEHRLVLFGTSDLATLLGLPPGSVPEGKASAKLVNLRAALDDKRSAGA